MLTLAHEAPGRLRLTAPALKTCPTYAAAVIRQAGMLPGVTDARVRRLTGSLVVLHDDAPGTRDRILQALGATLSAGPFAATNFLDAIAEAAADKLLDYAARALVASVL